MNVLIIFGTALTTLSALIGVLCIVLYARLGKLDARIHKNQEQWNRIEIKLAELSDAQERTHARIDQLSVDVLHREIYQGPEDRHQLAIKAAKEGDGVADLMQKHGLSADEASLVIALHGRSDRSPQHVINSVA